VVCNLRWEWELELELDGTRVSVFEVPREHVKGRRAPCGYVVCNSVAQSIVDSQRGLHADNVFVWRRERSREPGDAVYQDREPMAYRPIEMMNNSAWQRARARAGLGDLHVHDLRHTVGMRLREAGVTEETRAVILWHSSRSMATHYSAAQVLAVRRALEAIKDESGLQNCTLRSLAKEARQRRVPSESLREKKTG